MVNTNRGLARDTDPVTSHNAAASVNATRLEAMVYQAVHSFGADGAIAEEIKLRLNMDYNSVTPRIRPLINKGLLINTEWQRKASTNRGQMIVIAKPFWEEWVRQHQEYYDEL
jgi:hypothetical protein